MKPRDAVLEVLTVHGSPLHWQMVAKIIQVRYDPYWTEGTIENWLHRLVKSGELVRVRRGVYASHAGARRG